MALRGADVDADSLRASGAGVYLNQYHRTRAWVGADERAYAPGELLRGTAYLKNNPHPARRQLVLSQVDVYLSPECARRKRNFTHETRGHAAKRQNLTDIYYVRRTGPAGANTYRAYYNYGETIPPRDSPFRGPFQAQYHFRGRRFMGAAPGDHAAAELGRGRGEGDSTSSSDDFALLSARSAAALPQTLRASRLQLGDDADELRNPAHSLWREPAPIRHCVFKAARDGGPRALPSAHSETAFRFQLRVPIDAPENYAWAEMKDGCSIEIRYRLFVVFKLRAQPRNPQHASDPLFWEGASRTGEAPLIVLFAENYVGVDPAPDAEPRPNVYSLHAAPAAWHANVERARPRRRSILGRRSISVEVLGEGPHRIGEPLELGVRLRCAGAANGSSGGDGSGSATGAGCDFKVELVEKVELRQGRKLLTSKSVRTLMCRREVDRYGACETTVQISTDAGDIYPTARVGDMLVQHMVCVTLCPGERFAVTARVPVEMAPGIGRYLTRPEHNETLYPARARQPPWRRERSRRQERERVKRESIAALVDSMPECTAGDTHEDSAAAGHSDDDEDVCAICLDDRTAKKAVVLPCAHVLHAECIKDWIFQKSECPICKTAMA